MNHIPCMAHVIELALCAFMSSRGVNGRTKYWEAHQSDQQFGEHESIDIGKSQRLWTDGTARINKVLGMRPDLAKIIEKVHISWYFESPETDLHIVENGCWFNNVDTWSSKRLHWLSNRQSPHRGTSNYRCEDAFELSTGVTPAGLAITGFHRCMASTCKLHLILGTVHNTRWMEDFEVWCGSIEAIPILHSVHVEEAYGYIAWRYHSVQWHVSSHGWRDASVV
jgi:hypothetical protein